MEVSEFIYPIILFIGILAAILYSIKKAAEVFKARAVGQRGKGSPKGGLELPNSLYELFCNLEKGLDIQVQEIAKRCNAENKNPLEDVGYKTVLNQYQRVVDLRNKFETNPMYIMADQIGWPIVKGLVPDMFNMAKRLMRSFA